MLDTAIMVMVMVGNIDKLKGKVGTRELLRRGPVEDGALFLIQYTRPSRRGSTWRGIGAL